MDNSILQSIITIHWWNFNEKTLDFKGTLEECLKEKEIVFTTTQGDYGVMYIFSFWLGDNQITFKPTYDLEHTAWKVLAYKQVYLGDKTQIEFLGKKQKFNWR